MVIPTIISIVVNFYVGPPKTLENRWTSFIEMNILLPLNTHFHLDLPNLDAWKTYENIIKTSLPW